jgi:hypothetical protein
VLKWLTVTYPLGYYNAKFLTNIKSLAVQAPGKKKHFFFKKIKPLLKAFRKRFKGLFTQTAISESEFIVIGYYF